MKAWLARQLYRVQERCLRRGTFVLARELEWTQWSSPEELRRLQRFKLAALLNHAGERVPYYRAVIREAGVGRVDESTAIEALRRLPFLTKPIIRERLAELTWKEAPGGLFQSCTGGSTGEPLSFYIDRRRQACDQADRMRTHRWFAVQAGMRELYLWGARGDHLAYDRLRQIRDYALNQRLLNAFEMSAARMDRFVGEWNAFRPECVYGYPSSLALFCRHVQRRSVRLDTSRLRAIFVTGETCQEQDRQLISEVLQRPVADGYGSRDAGLIAHECSDGSMHLLGENVFVEVVAGDVPQPLGVQGEIVVTHLEAYGMPFLRYRTGDWGRLLPGRCRCGRGLPLMSAVQGRTTDSIYLPDGTVRHALSVIYPLREMREISQFRVTQDEDYAVTVDVVPISSSQCPSERAIIDSLLPVLGREIPIRVKRIDRIEPTGSGKHRYVISHVSQQKAMPMEVS